MVLVVKNPPAKAGDVRRHGFDPWVGKIPWRRKWQPTPVFLPGESQGQRSLAGYCTQGHTEIDMTEVTTHTQCNNVFIFSISFLFISLALKPSCNYAVLYNAVHQDFALYWPQYNKTVKETFKITMNKIAIITFYSTNIIGYLKILTL